MSTPPLEYLTPELAGLYLNPEQPDFWRDWTCSRIRDNLMTVSRTTPEYDYWGCILETRLYQDRNITLLHHDGTERDLTALPI